MNSLKEETTYSETPEDSTSLADLVHTKGDDVMNEYAALLYYAKWATVFHEAFASGAQHQQVHGMVVMMVLINCVEFNRRVYRLLKSFPYPIEVTRSEERHFNRIYILLK